MGMFSQLFKRTPEKPAIIQEVAKINEETEWQPVLGYQPANLEEYAHVSLIATAIASGDNPDSQFVVKKILKRNPEAKLVSLVAASLAAGVHENSQFRVRAISKKTNQEEA